MLAFVGAFASLPPFLKQNSFCWEEEIRHILRKAIHEYTQLYKFYATRRKRERVTNHGASEIRRNISD